MIRIDQNELCGLSGSILLLRRVWWQPAIGQTTIPHDVIWNVIWHFWYRTIRFDSIRWKWMFEDMITNHILSFAMDKSVLNWIRQNHERHEKWIRFDDFALKSRVITNAVECYVYEFCWCACALCNTMICYDKFMNIFEISDTIRHGILHASQSSRRKNIWGRRL